MQIQQLQKMWRELWFRMADGITSEYDKIKRVDVFEFYHLFDLWREKIDKEKKSYQSKNQQQHGKRQ